MAYETFRNWKPRHATLDLVLECVAIIEELSDYQLTLRQLYYQLVSRNVVPNTEKSYQKLSAVLTRARLAGLVDWNAIEDRVRQPSMPNEFRDLEELTNAALRSYRLDRWEGQDYYAELWVEKDALASVLQPLASQYHSVLMVNRGYSSASAMKAAAERFREHDDRILHLYYLGDLDPSGEDMVRDIDARLWEFGVSVEVKKIALTMDQVEEYDPPPNPTKLTDSRAPAFVEKYGTSSWEVDALTPMVLEEVISDAFEQIVDLDKMDAVRVQEEKDKQRLRRVVMNLNK